MFHICHGPLTVLTHGGPLHKIPGLWFWTLASDAFLATSHEACVQVYDDIMSNEAPRQNEDRWAIRNRPAVSICSMRAWLCVVSISDCLRVSGFTLGGYVQHIGFGIFVRSELLRVLLGRSQTLATTRAQLSPLIQYRRLSH